MRALGYGLVVWTGILSGIAVLRLARFEHEAMKILNVLEAPHAVSGAAPEASDWSSAPQQQTYTRVQGTALIASRLRLLTGYQPNPEEMDANEHPRIEQLHFLAPLQTSYVSPVADSFDGHITSWAGCPYQPVRNQGACGACYAFVVADAGRVALCRDAKRTGGDHAGNVPMLSPQVQVSCDASTKGCEGGSLFQAILWLAHVGSTWESCVPYSSQEGAAPPCHSFHCSLAANDTACPRPRTGLDAVFVPHTDVAAIKWYVSNVGPAIIGMTVHESFLLYDSGYYRAYDDDGALIVPNDKVHSAHAVVVVGYEYVRFQGEAASASRLAWICRNSWGLDWGENGFFRVFDSDRVHGAMFRYPRGALFLQKD